MSEEFVIYYELVYSVDKERIKKFLTLDIEEAKLKTSEVLGNALTVHLQFHKFSSTRANFLIELRKATLCL